MLRHYGVVLVILSTGCSVLLGNIRPVSEHSSAYRALDLSKKSADWVAVTPSDDSGNADLAYQHRQTGSIISLNSTCRERNTREDMTLQSVSQSLLLGITSPEEKTARDVKVAGEPGLETTVAGLMNGERMKLRVVVTRRAECLYDMMYVGKADRFAEHEATFSEFVAALVLH